MVTGSYYDMVGHDSRKANRRLCCLILLIVILGLAIIAAIVTAIMIKHDNKTGKFDSMGDPLKYFKVDDALKITWYHGANSKAKLSSALADSTHMIEGDIVFRYQGLANQTSEPIMAHPPQMDSDLTLSEWLDAILERKGKAPKLDFKNLEVVEPSLRLLAEKRDKISQPVWVNADIAQGPGETPPHISGPRFLEAVNTIFPRVTLSLGWTTKLGFNYTRTHIELLWQHILNVTQPITLPARAVALKNGWPHFKWLLSKSPDFSITVWTPASAEESWEGTDPYDLLYVRNDCDKKKIYYDLKGPKYGQFKMISETAGSLFNYFPMESRDGLRITWAHAANNRQQLQQALTSDVMMLEADVLLRGQGTANQTDIPVMAHPPLTDSDNTLSDWLQAVIPTQKGVKLDFKSIEVLEPSMKILNATKSRLHRPVWINADIFAGPNGKAMPVNATEFKRIVLKYFPECTLSIGWTTGYNNSGENEIYSKTLVEEMANYASEFKQPITFPIRASLVKASWDNLKFLLDQSRAYTLTIWGSKNDIVDANDMVFARNNYGIDRIYYDLPEPLMSDFIKKIS